MVRSLLRSLLGQETRSLEQQQRIERQKEHPPSVSGLLWRLGLDNRQWGGVVPQLPGDLSSHFKVLKVLGAGSYSKV